MKNKFLLLLPLLLFSFAFVSSATYITNCVELQNINNGLADDYFLSNDIDCSDTVNWNGGAGFAPIGSPYTTLFSGNLYGQGYTIDGLYVNRPNDDVVGFIGGMSNNIQDLKLTNAVIIGRNATSEDNVGGIVGYCQYSTLSNLEFSGSVTGGVRVGGIVGTLNNCVLSDSISSGTVTGFDVVGGVVGISAGNIYSSNSSSDVYYYGSQYGGIYGSDDGSGRIYENNFFTGTLTQLPLAEEEPQQILGSLINWKFDKLESPPITGDVTSEPSARIGFFQVLSNWFQNAFAWVRGLFN